MVKQRMRGKVAAGKQADTEKPPEPTDGGDAEDVDEVRADAHAFRFVGVGSVRVALFRPLASL